MSDDCHPPEKKFVQPIYPPSKFEALCDSTANFFLRPVVWFRETIVVPNRPEYPWYHQKYNRVKTIDQCYLDEVDCIYEANQQFVRDKAVDTNIISILRYRAEDCIREEYPDHKSRCWKLQEEYEVAAANWMAKYGDLGFSINAKTAYMKQKHRMIWERRHGPVGSGMKVDPYEPEPDGH